MLGELDKVVERYGDDRRTVILEGKDRTGFAYVETEVADEDVVITMSRQGYLKRVPMHLYRRRVAAGLALAAMERFPGDYLETVVVARTRGWLLSFTEFGTGVLSCAWRTSPRGRARRGASRCGRCWESTGATRSSPRAPSTTLPTTVSSHS